MSGRDDDPFSAFIRVLRSCAVFCVKNLFLTILNIVALVFFIFGHCLPWRWVCVRCPRSMSEFREASINALVCTIFDLVAFAFYLLAIFIPTRSIVSIRRIYDATFDKHDVFDLDEDQHYNEKVRWFLIFQAVNGILCRGRGRTGKNQDKSVAGLARESLLT